MVVQREHNRTSGPRTLLITDRDRDWCEHVGELAAPQGFQPRIAAGADAAIDLVERGGIDAAILGGRLERPDALTVLKVIRSINAGLPCVVVAQHMSRRVLEDALALAAFSVVQSPVDDQVLSEVVHRILERFFDRFDG